MGIHIKLTDEDNEYFLSLTDDEKIDYVAKRIIEECRPAFEALAKGDANVHVDTKEYKQ